MSFSTRLQFFLSLKKCIMHIMHIKIFDKLKLLKKAGTWNFLQRHRSHQSEMNGEHQNLLEMMMKRYVAREKHPVLWKHPVLLLLVLRIRIRILKLSGMLKISCLKTEILVSWKSMAKFCLSSRVPEFGHISQHFSYNEEVMVFLNNEQLHELAFKLPVQYSAKVQMCHWVQLWFWLFWLFVFTDIHSHKTETKFTNLFFNWTYRIRKKIVWLTQYVPSSTTMSYF